MPADPRRKQARPPGKSDQLRLVKPTTNGNRSVVLNHRGHAQEPTEDPDADVRDRVPVQVVHNDADPTDPIHLSEKLYGVVPVEVVEKECGVGHVERIVGIGKVESIADLDTGSGAVRRGKAGIEVGAAVPDRHGIQVDANGRNFAAAVGASTHEIHEVITAPGSKIEQ